MKFENLMPGGNMHDMLEREYASRESDEPEIVNAPARENEVYFGSSGKLFALAIFGSILFTVLLLCS